MSSITEFLKARIAEREASVADRRAGWGEQVRVEGEWYARRFDSPEAIDRDECECEAKRRIVEECEAMGDAGDILRILASVDADHPDYDEEWRV